MEARRPPYERDPFTFMIESLDATVRLLEPLGGGVNVRGAISACETLVANSGLSAKVQLHHGGRITRKAVGTAEIFWGGGRKGSSTSRDIAGARRRRKRLISSADPTKAFFSV